MRTKTTLEKAVNFVNNCKFIFSFKKNIFRRNLFSLLLFLFATVSFAQTKNADSYLSTLPSSDAIQIKHLLYDLQSAVYYLSDDRTVRTYGDNPIALFTDINSIPFLESASILGNDIEIATIKIETNADLNKTIDLSSFSGFSKLKYIYISTEVQTSEAVINNMIKNDTSKYVLIYNISIGG